MQTPLRILPPVGALALATLACFAPGPAPAERTGARSPFLNLKLDADAQAGGTADQVRRGLLRSGPAEPWQPKVDQEKTRGAAADVYPRVAPAVVVVRSPLGQGTGFVIDPAGWVVTNNHNLQDAPRDPVTGAQTLTVYLGRLDGDFMKLAPDGVPAQVHKASADKDLALLKLTRLPAGFKELPTVPLAKQAPRPGEDCVAIGHPRAGMLWAVRAGVITGVGKWPEELTEKVVTRLALKQEGDRDWMKKTLGAEPQMKVLISDCGINPGDSGGPLVNGRGEVIAVTFAVPKSQPGVGVNLDKLAYHIYLDELKEFLAERPEAPLSSTPDPWPPALFNKVLDLDGDGVADTLVCGLQAGAQPTGVLLDLKQQSARKFPEVAVGQPVRGRSWHFDFALHVQGQLRAFYDTDGDGTIDLVLTDADGDGRADSALRLAGGRWAGEEARGRQLIDATLFADAASRARFTRIAQRIGGAR